MNEKWKPIVGYEDFYEVSTHGRVRGVERTHLAKNPHTGAPMLRTRKRALKATTINKDGYYQVRLCRDGAARTLLVSRIVLLTFVGPGEEACHRNHNKQDNSLSNLIWGSRQANEDQKTSSGRRPVSTKGKLTPQTVRLARELYCKGLTYKQVAAKLSVHFSTVGYAVQRRTWSWV